MTAYEQWRSRALAAEAEAARLRAEVESLRSLVRPITVEEWQDLFDETARLMFLPGTLLGTRELAEVQIVARRRAANGERAAVRALNEVKP